MRSIIGMIFRITHPQCFEMIWRDERCRTISVEVSQLGIDQNRNPLVSERQDLAQYSRRYHAFIVV